MLMMDNGLYIVQGGSNEGNKITIGSDCLPVMTDEELACLLMILDRLLQLKERKTE